MNESIQAMVVSYKNLSREISALNEQIAELHEAGLLNVKEQNAIEKRLRDLHLENLIVDDGADLIRIMDHDQ